MFRFHALKNVDVVLSFLVKNYSMSNECCVSGCGNKKNRRNKMRLYPFPHNETENNSGSLNCYYCFCSVSVTTEEVDDLNVCSQHYVLIKVN